MKNTLLSGLLVIWLVGCGASRIKGDDALQNQGEDQKLASYSSDPANKENVELTAENERNTSTRTTAREKKMMSDGNRISAPLSDNFSGEEGVGTILKFLASDKLKGRDAGGEGIEEAARFIEYLFKENGVAPYFLSYRDTLTNFDKTAYNIVGYVPGNDVDLKHEFILIGAHYDHIGILTGVIGDTIANGANDNASGTTTVLELARYFGTTRTNKRSIIFALFSAEEKGLLGSEHLAKRLKAEKQDLYTMLNFEMVGVPLVDKDYFMYVTGYELSNLADEGNRLVQDNLIGYLPQAKELNLFKRSDNYPFYKEFNIPSQTFCTFDFTNFAEYHKVGDEADKMNFDHMATLVNRSIPLIEGIANSPAKIIRLY